MKRTGTVEAFTRLDGSTYYRVRIHLADGSRPRINIPAEFAGDAATREKYARKAQEHEDRTGSMIRGKKKAEASRVGVFTAGTSDTVNAYATKLYELREADGKNEAHTDLLTYRQHIAPRIGPRAMSGVTRDHIEAIRDDLDAHVRKRLADPTGKAGLSGKRVLNIWTVLRTIFSESVSSRDKSMRLRSEDPTVGHKPPLKTRKRVKTFVYPNEAAALLACEAVPLQWRECYAIAFYTYVRPGELRALTWDDIDLDAQVIHVTKGYDEDSRKTIQTKSVNGVRQVPIEAALVPLLDRMKKTATGPTVLPILEEHDDNVRADFLRSHLRIAKCDRPRLFADTASTMQINFRSCRDSGITWLAMAGIDLAKMQRRAGHEDIKTTLGYVKLAEDLSGRMGAPFAPLPDSLTVQPAVQTKGQKREPMAFPVVESCRRRDLNSASPSTDDASPRESAAIVNPSRPQKERVDGLDSRLDSLRQALDAAIVAQQWGAVEAINSRLRELERKGVIDLATARAKRGG